MLTIRGLGVVLGDLAALGYDARWGVVSAADAGAPHLRERCWILAHADQRRRQWSGATQEKQPDADAAERSQIAAWWTSDSGMVRVAHGVAHRVDRIGCLGNGQVPAVVRLAWETLMGTSMHNGEHKQ